MSLAHRQSLIRSTLGFIFCSVLTTAVPGLYAQQPFGGRPRYTQPTVLSPVVNDMVDGTDSPSISGDGLTIYYNGYPDNSRIPSIWQATRPSTDAEWENAHRLSDAVNSSLRNMSPDVTADGLELYFLSSDEHAVYDVPRPDDSLMVAIRTSTDDAWGEAERLSESINSLPCPGSPTVTGDGLELYFYSVDADGDKCRQGRYADIYVSKRATRDDAWGEPQLVEPVALWPAISPDGLALYFNGGERATREAMGLPATTFDNGPSVFVRTRNSRDEEFGPAIELGDPPNSSSASTAASAPDVSSDGKTFYFSSDRPGAPKEFGIWTTTLAEPCDINADGSCNVDDLSRSALYHVNLPEGSMRESDVVNFDISGDGRVDENDLVTWLAEAAASNGFASPFVRGDANLDGRFNMNDVVNVLQAGEYNDSISFNSTWMEGDWNGDSDFDSLDVVVALQDGGYVGAMAAQQRDARLTDPYAAVQAGGTIGDAQTSVIYDAGTGELSVDAPAGIELTSINIDSAAGIFIGEVAANLGGSFDNDADANIFKATFGSSFGSLSFGNVAQLGLSEESLLSDLTVIGSLAGGGDLGIVDLVYVPEPATVLLLSIGLAIGLLHLRRVTR